MAKSQHNNNFGTKNFTKSNRVKSALILSKAKSQDEHLNKNGGNLRPKANKITI